MDYPSIAATLHALGQVSLQAGDDSFDMIFLASCGSSSWRHALSSDTFWAVRFEDWSLKYVSQHLNDESLQSSHRDEGLVSHRSPHVFGFAQALCTNHCWLHNKKGLLGPSLASSELPILTAVNKQDQPMALQSWSCLKILGFWWSSAERCCPREASAFGPGRIDSLRIIHQRAFLEMSKMRGSYPAMGQLPLLLLASAAKVPDDRMRLQNTESIRVGKLPTSYFEIGTLW